MIIDNSLVGDLALGSDKNTPTEDDARTLLYPSIQPVVSLLRAHHIATPNSGADLQSSAFVERLTTVIALGGATATVLAQLPRGLWTVAWTLSARFDFTQTLAVLDHQVQFDLQYEADTRRIAGFYARIGTVELTGSFRVLNQTRADLRLDTQAALAAQNFEAHLGLMIERNI